jgi:photosystem II stability/assembly factor-like uncharacterized protein
MVVSPAYSSDHALFIGAVKGVYMSSDNGDSWSTAPSGYYTKALAVSPTFASDRTIFAGTYLNGVYKSTNGGSSWVSTSVGLANTMVFSLTISPNYSSDHTIFAGLYANSTAAVYKSTDGGGTWVASNSGLGSVSAISLAISPAYTSDHTIFAVTTDGVYGNGGPFYHVYKSIDDGASWSLADAGLTGLTASVVISPGYANDKTLFISTSTGVYKSVDSGATWVQIFSSTASKNIALSPGYVNDHSLFVSVYKDAIYRSSNGGSTWSKSNASFAVGNQQFHSLAVSPAFSSDHTVFATTSQLGPIFQVNSNPAFGNVKINSTSSTKQLNVSNHSSADVSLVISGVSISGVDAGQFNISPGNCGSLTPIIAIGAQCSFDVTFTPLSSGNKSAQIQISSNYSSVPTTNVSVSGTGIAVTSTILTPATGYITNEQNITVSGTASVAGGDALALVEVSIDNGATWQPASGTGSWSINLSFPSTGTFAVLSRATSSGGIIETPGTGISIAIVPPINGTCGSATGLFYSATPAENLCAAGNASAVSGIGPWSWNCSGINGGTTATCSAAQAGGFVYRSADAGVNWTAGKTGFGINSDTTPLVVSPAFATDHTLFVGTSTGVYKSNDSGDTLTQVLAGGKIEALVVSPAFATDQTLFAYSQYFGASKSIDGGETWLPANTGLSTGNQDIKALAISADYENDHTVFAGFTGWSSSPIVYKSTDGDANWVAINTGLPLMIDVTALAISPNYTNDSTIYVATTAVDYLSGGLPEQVYRSIDGGAHWTLMSTFPRVITAMTISPGYASDHTVIVTTTKGIFKTTNQGVSWPPVNTTQYVYSVVLSPSYTIDQTLFAGVYDANRYYTSINGGSTLSAINSSFVPANQYGQLAVSPAFASDHTMFTATYLKGPSISRTATVSFGNVRTGSSQSSQVTLKNISASEVNLVINSMMLSGTGASQFSIAPGSCGSLTPVLVLAGGASCAVDVTFSPDSAGSKSATMQIISNDILYSQVNVSLSGTGAAPGVCGSDNGKSIAATAPITLCAPGTPSAVTGNGHPWTWRCQGDAGTVPAVCSASIQTYSLVVSVPEAAGTGDVQADIASNDEPAIVIYCPKGLCSAHYDFGKVVRLTASPDTISLFTSLGSGCISNPCDVEMLGDRSFIANFTRDDNFRIVRDNTSNNALDNLLPVADSGDEVRMLATGITINSLVLDKALTLSGGWKAQHQEQSSDPTILDGTITVKTVQDAKSLIADTTVKGALAVQSGLLRVNRVNVRSTAEPLP